MIKKFGNIECVSIHGSPTWEQEETESWTIPGRNGIGVRAIGKRVKETNIEVVCFGTKAQCFNIDAAIKKYSGTVVRVIDDMERSYKLYVLNSSTAEYKGVYVPGTEAEVMLQVKITGLVVS